MKEFKYYIFVDYSQNIIGYTIIEKSKIKELLPKISRLHHYRNIRHKREYISAMKTRFRREGIIGLLLKWKIRKVRLNLDIFTDIIEFVKKNDYCAIFMSVDNNQYYAFTKLLEILPHQRHLIILKESKLKKGSVEYKLSLIIDTMLNIERRS